MLICNIAILSDNDVSYYARYSWLHCVVTIKRKNNLHEYKFHTERCHVQSTVTLKGYLPNTFYLKKELYKWFIMCQNKA